MGGENTRIYISILVITSASLIAYGIIFKSLYFGITGYILLLVSVIWHIRSSYKELYNRESEDSIVADIDKKESEKKESVNVLETETKESEKKEIKDAFDESTLFIANKKQSFLSTGFANPNSFIIRPTRHGSVMLNPQQALSLNENPNTINVNKFGYLNINFDDETPNLININNALFHTDIWLKSKQQNSASEYCDKHPKKSKSTFDSYNVNDYSRDDENTDYQLAYQ